MNERPLPCVLAGFVLGEVWIWQFHGTAALAALVFATVILIIIDRRKRGSFFILSMIGIGLLLGGSRQFQWERNKEDFNRYKTEQASLVQGQIDEIIKKEYSFSLVVDQLIVNGEEQRGKLLVYADKETECYIGSRITVEGRIEDFERPTNPGGFDQKVYREAKGILAVMYGAEVKKVSFGSFMLKDGIYSFRQKTAEYLQTHMSTDTSGIGIAMALGEKESLMEEQKALYELGGISHVLAVSGLHMSLLGAGIYKIFRKIGLGYGISVSASLPCILVYAIMTGMSSSCLRAGIMLTIFLVAEWKGYYYDLPSSLSFAGIWLLMEIPARLFDSGFLLSFAAMISVGLICPFLFQLFHYKTGVSKVRDSFCSGIVITLFTLPFSLYYFYGISIAGLFLNLLVIPLMTPLVPLIFIGGVGWLPFIPETFAFLCLKPAEMILEFYHFLCQIARNFPLSYMQAGFRGVTFAVWYYAILVGFLILFYFSRKKKILGLFLTSIMLSTILVFIHFTGRNDSYLTVLNVGQGDGILYHSAQGEVCMIDGGSTSEKNVGKYVIQPTLEYYGISSVDYWFVSHMDEDHISGLRELLESGYPIKNLILPVRKEVSEGQQEIENLAQQNGTQVYYMKQGDSLGLKKEVFYCLYPKNKNLNMDENQNSLVLLLETDYQQILLTGDVEKEGESDMTQYLDKLNVNQNKEQILKVPHHGSANGTGEKLLETFDPDTAIISCSERNRYGHPAKETVQRLENAGVSIYYTMRQGAIEVLCTEKTKYYGYGTSGQ